MSTKSILTLICCTLLAAFLTAGSAHAASMQPQSHAELPSLGLILGPLK